MNSKKSKALRRLVRQVKADKEERVLEVKQHHTKTVLKDGRVRNRVSNQAVNAIDTKRGLFRALKKNPTLYNQTEEKQ